ncbi:hypothetical protein BRADI_4g37420v3 [Brachypodium distachyon]|uniref:Uncharacterized protein n=1 Tax=Brachypodium distachyon TaxID=15368 RepID=A0A2K2CSW8_BRADI|nr:hypothetical protein BRADI_4g37420v3 [Brachypodium distachyon]
MGSRGGGGTSGAEAPRRSGRGGAGGMRLFSPEYYALCAGGGMLAAGTTHLAITPLDVLKVNMQTQPMFAKGLVDGFPRVYAAEGLSGFYRGLLPLWGRNLPFSMLMFSTFEHTVGFLYQKVIQKKKEDCSTAQQLGATCLAGYISGAVGTVVSNPADNIVSSLYNKKAKNIIHAVKSIGLRGLFTRSLPIRITLVGPVVTMQWFFYDSIKILTGLPPSGGLPRELEEANT